MAEFERIVPGSAARIIDMAHAQSNHRMSLEDFAIKANYRKAFKGQWFGFTLGAFGIIASVALGVLGHDVLAGTIGSLSIGSLAVVFVVGRDKQKKSLEQKKPT